jgi:sirohydrochlorin cobaltochelatase
MAMTDTERASLDELDLRLRTMLPDEYQESYESVEPVPMRSAPLVYDSEGKVAWDEIWETFCDLAMAGGPPHKGTLLAPGDPAAIAAQRERYDDVATEACRGVMMAAQLPADPSPDAGWIRVECLSPAMAAWLLRAVVMENVAARAEGTLLDLPVGPAYRLEKEIKNVVTVITKTSHYWLDHMAISQQRAVADLLARTSRESPLIEPASWMRVADSAERDASTEAIGQAIHAATGLHTTPRQYAGWLGVEHQDVRAAIWSMRALVVHNVLSRREGTVLFVPINPGQDPRGERVVRDLTRVHRLAAAKAAA